MGGASTGVGDLYSTAAETIRPAVVGPGIRPTPRQLGCLLRCLGEAAWKHEQHTKTFLTRTDDTRTGSAPDKALAAHRRARELRGLCLETARATPSTDVERLLMLMTQTADASAMLTEKPPYEREDRREALRTIAAVCPLIDPEKVLAACAEPEATFVRQVIGDDRAEHYPEWSRGLGVPLDCPRLIPTPPKTR